MKSIRDGCLKIRHCFAGTFFLFNAVPHDHIAATVEAETSRKIEHPLTYRTRSRLRYVLKLRNSFSNSATINLPLFLDAYPRPQKTPLLNCYHLLLSTYQIYSEYSSVADTIAEAAVSTVVVRSIRFSGSSPRQQV